MYRKIIESPVVKPADDHAGYTVVMMQNPKTGMFLTYLQDHETGSDKVRRYFEAHEYATALRDFADRYEDLCHRFQLVAA